MNLQSVINELHEIRAYAQLVIDSTVRLEKKIAAGVSTPAKTRKGPLSEGQVTRLLANHLKGRHKKASA